MSAAELEAFRRWALAGGVYSIAAGLPLAIPGMDVHYYRSMNKLNDLLGLGGNPVTMPTNALHRLFMSASGLMLCSMGGMLLYASGDLRGRGGIAFVNVLTRIASIALFLYYGFTARVARVVMSIAVIDIIFAGMYLRYLSKMQRAR